MKTIFKFEFLYNYRRPFTYVLFALMIVQGIWYSVGGADYYGNANTLLNAASIFYQSLSVTGMIAIIAIAIVSANSLARDVESATAEGLFSKAPSDKKYFMGKYFCSLLVGFILLMFYPVGMLLVPYLGVGTPEQFGPVPWGPIGHAILVFTIPNLIFMVSLSFFLIVYTRRSGSAYVGTLFIMVLIMVGDFVRGETHFPEIVHMLDAFSFAGVMDTIDSLGVAERNTAYLPIIPSVVANRIIWLTISVGLFFAALWRFDFKYFVARSSKKKAADAGEENAPAIGALAIPAVTTVHDGLSLVSRAFRFAWADFRSLSRTAFFRFVLALFFMSFMLTHMVWTSQYYITTSHLPLTYTLTYARIPMIVMIIVIMIILSVEHLFRERTTGVWQITDAMPVPNWLFLVSKFITLAGVAFSILAMTLVTGLVFQLFSGFTDIDWGLYVRDLFGPRFGWITLLQIVSFAFFVGALFANRFKGHIIAISVFLFIIISLDLDLIEQLRFAFSFVPGTMDYSEMIGYGIFDTALPWYAWAWVFLGLIMLILATLLWNRGTDRPLAQRLRAAGKRLTPAVWGALGGLAALFVLCQWVIHDNVMVKAQYQTIGEEDAEDAAYERAYASIAQMPQPKITALSLDLDIFPDVRTARYEADLTLENRSDSPIETLHVDLRDFLTIEKMETGRDLVKTEEDETLRHSVYKLSPPLSPGETMPLSIAARLQYEGFHQSDPQVDLTRKTALLGTDLLPYFGYDEDRRLTNNKDRIEQGLSPLTSRTAAWENAFARTHSVISDQADLLSWDITVSVPGDWQTAVPGKRTESWQKDGRNYVRYVSETPGHLDFKVMGAAYDVHEFSVDGHPVSMLYHPPHPYNIEALASATDRAFSWLSETMGPYPYSSLQIAEKTNFDDDFLTFSNVIAISETHGWTADIEKPEDRDYLYYTLARELARQWTTAGLVPADVRGAEIFTESIPAYLALAFMEDAFGLERTAVWLDDNYDDYQEGKGEEEITETPLLSVDEATYISREKGGLLLRAISRQWGPDHFNAWLKAWLEEAMSRSEAGFIISRDFYQDLLAALPEKLHAFAEECFTQRIQYSLALDRAVFEEGVLIIDVTAARGLMDGLGNLTEAAGSFPVTVAFLDENGARIGTEEIMLDPGAGSQRFPLAKRPDKIVLDPDYWYLVEQRDKTARQVK